jgi:hypothetical protein
MKTQAGFRTDHGCPDAVGPLKVALQTLKESGWLFVDIVKTFDRVNREMLWQILEKYGLMDNLITVIKKIYSGIFVEFQIGTAEGSFESTSGVKQVTPRHRLIFICNAAAVETMNKSWPAPFRMVSLAELGQPIYKGSLTKRNENASAYVNYTNTTCRWSLPDLPLDVGPIDPNNTRSWFFWFIWIEGWMFTLVCVVGTWTGKDLQSKILAMFFSQNHKNNTPEELRTGSCNLDDGTFCTQFKYLGSIVTPDHSENTEIKRRVSLAQGASENAVWSTFEM